MNELQELYDAIKDVCSVLDDKNNSIDVIEEIKTLKEKYNNLCECEEEKI